jgi:hypothetical protein
MAIGLLVALVLSAPHAAEGWGAGSVTALLTVPCAIVAIA